DLKLNLSLFLFFAIFFMPMVCNAKADFLLDRDVVTIYQSAFDLKLEKAGTQIKKAKNSRPDNLMLVFLEHYTDFLRAFTSEEKVAVDRLEKNLSQRIQKIHKGDKKSPFRLFLQAEMHLQVGLVRLKFNKQIAAAQEIKKANDLLIKNKRLFPGFIENDKTLAIIHGLSGTIPDSYKGLVNLVTGLEGSVPEGISMIRKVVENLRKRKTSLFYKESVIIFAMMTLHLGDDKEASWNIIHNSGLDISGSLLAVYAKAHIARSSGRTAIAIELLENRPKGGEYSSFYLLDLMLGINRLHQLNPKAKDDLIRFLKNYKGHNFIKEAYQKLAWFSIALHNDQASASVFYNACRSKGYADSEEDQSAMMEAKSGKIPQRDLLKARLLTDGAYFEKSLKLLQEERKVLDKVDALQTQYLIARNYQSLGRSEDALKYFNRLLTDYPKSREYQVCNAALQSGLISEKNGDVGKAKYYYRKCLGLNPEKYKSGIHQKAEAGLNRLK
ncbi:MAG TPA: tetratricopeptide repeat protein, partial [Saprospiraceae bacterium]|nr:tetratricopeptide repeat protein [Saprospiraceae bacterium]